MCYCVDFFFRSFVANFLRSYLNVSMGKQEHILMHTAFTQVFYAFMYIICARV